MIEKLQFETVLEQSNDKVTVIVDDFVQYDPMSDIDTGYTSYRVILDGTDITDDLTLDESIQVDQEAYEYCVDQIGITEDKEMEVKELNFNKDY